MELFGSPRRSTHRGVANFVSTLLVFITFSLRVTTGLRLNEYSETFVEVIWSPHHNHLTFLHCYFNPNDNTYEHSYTKNLPKNCSANTSNLCFSVYHELDWCFGITKCSFFVVWKTAQDLYSQKQLCEVLTEDSSSIASSYEIILPRSVDSLSDRNLGYSFCGTKWIQTSLTPGNSNNCSNEGLVHIKSLTFTQLNMKETFVKSTVLLCNNISSNIYVEIKQNEHLLSLDMNEISTYFENGLSFAYMSAVFNPFMLNDAARHSVYANFLSDPGLDPVQFSVLTRMERISIVVDSVEVSAHSFNGTVFEANKTSCDSQVIPYNWIIVEYFQETLLISMRTIIPEENGKVII